MANLKRSYQGFKRTNWENKEGNQARKQVIKHYETLGKKVPKYVTEGNFTKSKMQKALHTIENGYKKVVTYTPPKINVNTLKSKYERVKNKYNKTLNRFMLGGRTDLEKMYLTGQPLFIPHIRDKAFYGDKLTLRPIGNERFKNENAMKERIKQIQKQTKDLQKDSDNYFYNIKSNKQAFKDMITTLQATQLSKDELNALKGMYSTMTPFEQEIFVKTRLSQLKEEYEIDEFTGEKELKSIYDGMMYGMLNIMHSNRPITFESMNK